MNTASRPRFSQLPNIVRTCLRQAHRGPKKEFQGPQGHGEKIWVFRHRRSDQIVYSFDERLDGFHALKQMPFNGKKTKPAKLRKDYWSPMAMIKFPEGQGAIGRSVYQKLRELKHLHEVNWDDEFRYKSADEFTAVDKKKIADEKAKGNDYRPVRSKSERGVALNAQRTNSIADMAAVLAGQGHGNAVAGAGEATDGQNELVQVSISWANDQDKEYAESWSKNVTHGLFEQPVYTSGKEAESTLTA
ncbi:transcriptional regulation of mitochondrial recombination domain-containing protein [Pochonia chlamydosporia 170]|uniref:Large ribosomal subunit protein mL67 n=1 Tax=Pochonia chlamydosporia 170 TaxID=1380566 RepID=A0A179FRA2_METCM|nr:transcriptional regulation of mitochondrial recombination domain-containing protein [Pochonia chlamydosporia 170]OAQ68134.1 transcriptional regulation of mitochondrial recombination domain-containing protein [Pochonia chlamydosporia 170]